MGWQVTLKDVWASAREEVRFNKTDGRRYLTMDDPENDNVMVFAPLPPGGSRNTTEGEVSYKLVKTTNGLSPDHCLTAPRSDKYTDTGVRIERWCTPRPS
jgi:hypothetical protein